jgi:hypothetical protein
MGASGPMILQAGWCFDWQRLVQTIRNGVGDILLSESKENIHTGASF